MGADGDLLLRLVAMAVLGVAAVGVALAFQRRRPDPPSAPSYRAPSQLDRADFDHSDRPDLVVVFASTTCDSCAGVWSAVQGLESDQVGVQRVDVQSTPGLHQRYRIDGVPTTVVANHNGVVVQTWFGPVDIDDVSSVLARLQGEPDSDEF